MEYQVLFEDCNGCKIATPNMNEHDKNVYVEMLEMNGFKYDVIEREDRKWHCARVVFNLQLIEAARKAVKEGKDMEGLYTYGDPNEIAKKDKVVEVECTDSRLKNAYVIDIWLATADEIKEFKERIKYPHLGLVKKGV